MKKFAKMASLVMAVCMILTALAGCGNKEKAEKCIYIGASGPLTGGAAVYGKAVQNGANMAVDEINENGGLNGTKLKFVIMDDAHDKTRVPTNFTTMYEEGMQVSLGCVTTNPCLEFKSLSNDDKVFFITPSATADSVVEFDNAYQMCFADTKQGIGAASYVNENFSGQTIGMLYRADDVYSTGIREQFLNKLDKSVTVKEASFTGDTVASFNAQINTLKSCKFIFMPIYSAPAAQFMTEAKDTIAKDAVYYGCDGLDGIDTSVEGFDITTIPQEVSFLSHFNSKATDGASGDFIKKYVEKYGKDTLNQFGASAYDCVYALFGAMKEAGNIDSDTSAEDVYTALKGVFQGGYKFSGVTGENMTWDKSGFVQKDALKFIVKESSAK